MAEKITKVIDIQAGNSTRTVRDVANSVNNLTTEFKSQRAELAALKNELANMDEGTAEYNAAFERAAELTFQLRERQEQLKMSANDVGEQLNNVTNIGGGLIAGFNAINAVMALTNQDSVDLQKTMLKLQSGMAIVQGLKGLDGLTKGLKAYSSWANKAYDRIVNTIKGYNKQATAIKTNTTALQGNATAEGAAAVGAEELGASMNKAAAGTNVASTSLRALKTALISTGIGALVVAVGALAGKLLELTKNAKDAKKVLGDNYDSDRVWFELEDKIFKKKIDNIKRETELAIAGGKDRKEALEEENEKLRKLYETETEGVSIAKKIRTEAQKIMSDEIQKSGEKVIYTPKPDVLKPYIKETETLAGESLSTIINYVHKAYDEGYEQTKNLIDSGNKSTYDNIIENGVRTLYELDKVTVWYLKAQEDARGNVLDSVIKSNNEEIELEEKKNEAKEKEDAKARTKALEEAKKAQDEATKAEIEGIKKRAEESLKTELEKLDERYEKEKKLFENNGIDITTLTKEYENQRAKIIEENNNKIAEQQRKAFEDAAKERKKFYDDEIKDIKENTDNKLRAIEQEEQEKLTKKTGLFATTWGASQTESYGQKKSVLDDTYSAETKGLEEQRDVYKKAMEDMTLAEEDRLEARQKYNDAVYALQDAEVQHTIDSNKLIIDENRELVNTMVDVGNSIADILGSVVDALDNWVDAQVKDGKMSEEEAEKQKEKYRWLQYTQAIISTAAGALGAFTQASATIPPPYGQIVGAAAAAAVVAAGVAQIAQIKNASKSSNVSSSSAMGAAVATPAQYTPDYSANLTGLQDTEYLRNALGGTPIYVRVTDIEAAQSGLQTKVQEASF